MTLRKPLGVVVVLACLASPALASGWPPSAHEGASPEAMLSDSVVTTALLAHLAPGELDLLRDMARQAALPDGYLRPAEREEGAPSDAPLMAGACVPAGCDVGQFKLVVAADGRAWVGLSRGSGWMVLGPPPPEEVERLLEPFPGC
ncbi:hypothetical protein [Falsiroseomonas oryziterrae]|uniref:hypothetical protein n=1 Tax=Falsiroseomonas oryziterrae TaxID=2911368 RepID=UPI001F1B5276|nr:hypothetical protein [Roseomonas sp. NPKOSM-4]